MSAEFFHLSPVILTDDLFFMYRPDCMVTGTATIRQAAYLTAEQQMIRAIGTPLQPTTITGTYVPAGNPLVLEFDRVISIDAVTVKTHDGGYTCTLTREDGCGLIRDSVGYIDVYRISSLARANCGSRGLMGSAYQFEVAYTAGLPTGISAVDSNLHIALSMAAELDIKEMVDPGALEGGAGDPGVQSFSTEGYSETRTGLKNTPFGSSALANHIYNRVRHLRRKRALRF